MKTKVLLFIFLAITSIVFAQIYVLEWQSPDGWEPEEQFIDGSVTSESMIMNTDLNKDWNQDFIIRDCVNNIINVYHMNPPSYDLLWSYQTPDIPGTDNSPMFCGFADITDEITNELVLLYDQVEEETNTLVVVNTSSNEHTIISEEVRWEPIVWHINEEKSKLIFQVGNHVEIWGDGTTAVDEKSIQSPKLKLNQNHPNPFNPTTTINYQLKKSGYIELKIYNIKGQLVDTLVKGNQKEGNHSFTWNAKGISSGMYFYQISVDGQLTKTKKAICVK